MKLGIAFSGGGVRSASQLGIMQSFYEAGIKPDIFVGTSGGSIVATLLALGYEPKKALELFSETHSFLDIAYWHIFKGIFRKEKIQGIFKGNKLEKSLNQIFDGKVFKDVTYPLGVVSTNILSGKEVIFTNTDVHDPTKVNNRLVDIINGGELPLKDAVRASNGFPIIFLPKEIGGYKLIDGGVTNNLPSDIADALGADRVISIDVGNFGNDYKVGGVLSILLRSYSIIFKRAVDTNYRSYDIYINPNISNVGILDTKSIHACYQKGYEYGNKIVENVKYALENDQSLYI